MPAPAQLWRGSHSEYHHNYQSTYKREKSHHRWKVKETGEEPHLFCFNNTLAGTNPSVWENCNASWGKGSSALKTSHKAPLLVSLPQQYLPTGDQTSKPIQMESSHNAIRGVNSTNPPQYHGSHGECSIPPHITFKENMNMDSFQA